MDKYYFLTCSLPPLFFGQKPDLFYEELKDLLQWSLTEKDKMVLTSLKCYVDLKNLKAVWLDKEIDHRGNLDEKRLKQALLTEDHFPDYVFEYIRNNPDDLNKVKNFNYLLATFFRNEIHNNQNNFVKNYFLLERDIRFVFTALRAKEIKKNIEQEFYVEDTQEILVEQILSQKDQNSYRPPIEYEELFDIYEKNKDSPLRLQREYLKYRFNKNLEIGEQNPFTIEQILGYLVNLVLVEDFYNLNKEKGKTLIDSLI